MNKRTNRNRIPQDMPFVRVVQWVQFWFSREMDSYQTETLIRSLLHLIVFPSLQQQSFNHVDQDFT